jgi:hypothetical protein
VVAANMVGRPISLRGVAQIKVLDTLGLISASFGQWDGVPGGQHVETGADAGGPGPRAGAAGPRVRLMHITFKRDASLPQHLPPEHRAGKQMPLLVPKGATLAQVIEPFALHESVERETGCTEADWQRWLPGAVRHQRWRGGPAVAEVRIGGSRLCLRWQPLPPRRTALVTLPRLQVRFVFEGAVPAERAAFMRCFDLFLQRAGG